MKRLSSRDRSRLNVDVDEGAVNIVDGPVERGGSGRQPDQPEACTPRRVELAGRFHVQRGHMPGAGTLDELLRVVGIAATDNHDRVDPVEE